MQILLKQMNDLLAESQVSSWEDITGVIRQLQFN